MSRVSKPEWCPLMPPNTFHPDKGGEPQEVEILYLPALPESVRLTRSLVTSCLPKWGLDDFVFPCTQTVTELAANAVAEIASKGPSENCETAHDQSPERFAVHLYRTDTHLFIKVVDTSPKLPKPRTAAEQDEDGRGLALVEALADHWGWYSDEPDGKVVYAAWELPAVQTAPSLTEAAE